MEAKETAAGELFVELQLRVPQWQRHYSWTKAEFSELWSDLHRLMNDDEGSHFLGSFVLQMLPFDGMPNSVKTYWLVDGQQRAATLTILLCAIRDHIVELQDGEDERNGRWSSLSYRFLKNRDVSQSDTPRLKMQPQDHEALASIVNGSMEPNESSGMNQAYAFFREKIGALNIALCEKLISVVTTKLKIVWVQLSSSDNAHRVFQTLNAGGKQLEQVDLIRNYFFLLLGERGDEFYQRRWMPMEESLPKKELKRYLVAWSISQGYFGTDGKLFKYFQSDLAAIESRPEEVLDYGISLTNAAKLWTKILLPETSSYSDKVKATLIDFNNWRTEVADGVLLWLARLHEAGDLSSAELHEAFETILGYMARRIAAGYEPNSHKPTLARLGMSGHAMKASGRLPSGQDVVKFLKYRLSRSEEIKIWPRDHMVKANARTAIAYTRRRSHWTQLLLERANRTLYQHPNHVPAPLSRENLSVEHIMPQTLNAEWIQDFESWGVTDPISVHDEKLHVLGNLTITQINSDLGNRRFSEKTRLLADDPLRLNKQIADLDEWTASSIDERSGKLASAICAAFVGPLTDEDVAELDGLFGEDSAGELEWEDESADEE